MKKIIRQIKKNQENALMKITKIIRNIKKLKDIIRNNNNKLKKIIWGNLRKILKLRKIKKMIITIEKNRENHLKDKWKIKQLRNEIKTISKNNKK